LQKNFDKRRFVNILFIIMKDVTINIHICLNALLGLPRGIEWRQDNICVPYWRVYWNDAPGAFVLTDGEKHELLPDEVMAIPPRTRYSTRAELETTHFYLHFSVSDPFDAVKPEVLLFRDRRIVNFARELSEELKKSAPNARTMLKIQRYICEILLAVPKSNLPEERFADPVVEQAIAISDEYPELTINDLADKMNLCRGNLIRRFVHVTGMTPQKFLRRRRLERAAMLLHFSNKNIKQIAQETGFCDRYHFSRLFTREFDYTPATYKRQMDLPESPEKLAGKLGDK